MRPGLLCAWFGLLLATAAAAAPSQRAKPDLCPWCKNDPALLAASGLVSHGPVAIGAADSVALAGLDRGASWYLAETAHLRWAASFSSFALDGPEKPRILAELERLRVKLPDLPKEIKRVDPWLRIHLYAQRGEELYARFQELLAVTDADFPESRGDGPFMGDGRFLGEKEKFEVVVHPGGDAHQAFTRGFCGVAVTDTVRWHFNGVHKILLSVPGIDEFRQERWLWPHVAHNLAHAWLAAYKHYSYDPPAWLDEGLALAIEKEIEPASASSCGEEGTKRDGRGPKDWTAHARKLVSSSKAPTAATLMRARVYGELDLDACVTSWSRLRFLIDVHPGELARFLGGIKGQLDEHGIPTGRDLTELQRKLLEACFGWQPFGFDEAWKSWLVR